jgi:hypothetical protein
MQSANMLGKSQRLRAPARFLSAQIVPETMEMN